MSETKSILRAAIDLRREGKPFLVATVVRVRGSSYRRPGARMILAEDRRWLAGSVSGGCLEGDVARRGWWRMRDGGPVLVTYDATADDDMQWRLGIGCDGVVDVLLERVDGEGPTDGGFDPLRFFGHCLETQSRGAVATVFESEAEGAAVGARVWSSGADEGWTRGLDAELRAQMVGDARIAAALGDTRVHSYEVEGRPVQVLAQAVLPPPCLFLFGAGHDAVPVMDLARAVGWDVVVCDTQDRFVTRERFASADALVVGAPEEMRARVDACDRAMAVVMSHHYENDRAAVAMLLRSRARYIGVLGPRRRTDRILADLGHSRDERVHAPVGLAIGAESPQEIALAVVAEVQSVLARAPCDSLRERVGPIHATAAPRTHRAAAQPPRPS